MPREVVHDHQGQKASGLGVSGEAIYPSEVLERHGVGGNAEILIQAVREHNPPALKAASAKKRVNGWRFDPATGELSNPNEDSIDVAEIAGEGATVHDAAVRGVQSVVYTAADSQGTLYKGTFEINDPEETHVSQAEVLAQEGSVAASVINPRRAARAAAVDNAQRTLDAREKALAKRERELAKREKAAGAETEGEGEGEGDGEGEGEGPELPDALPNDYDELNKDDAAAAVAKLEGDDLIAALDYERANKNRKTVTGDE